MLNNLEGEWVSLGQTFLLRHNCILDFTYIFSGSELCCHSLCFVYNVWFTYGNLLGDDIFHLLFLSNSSLPSLSPSPRRASALDSYFIFPEIMLQNTLKKKKGLHHFHLNFLNLISSFIRWRPWYFPLLVWGSGLACGGHSDQFVELSLECLANVRCSTNVTPLPHLSARDTKMRET